ncbi:MAG TPA: sigma-70 family RNA polymerase sigma factor [Terriglobia bacterium]
MRETPESDWVVEALGLYEARLLRYATWVLRDPDLARDVVQETFLRLCREQPSTVGGHLAQWLFTVCRNLAFDTRKKEVRMAPLEEVQTTVDAAIHSGIEQRETVGEIFKLLEDLPKNQREVIYLKFQCDLSYKEISEVTKLSVTNVGFLIHTALKTIRKRVLSEPARRNP